MTSGERAPLALRCYSALLRLYPAAFRRQFGQDMEELFLDQWRAAGARTPVRFWLSIVRDAMESSAREHAASLTERLRDAIVPDGAATPPATSGESMLETLRYDLRYTLRMLRKSPTFTLVAVLVIALGSGAVTTIFSAANALLLRPIPATTEPKQLYDIGRTSQSGNSSLSISYPFYQHVRDESRTLNGIAAWTFMQLTVSTGGQGTSTFANMVSANYFDVLGVRPAMGRFFIAEEERTPGAHPVIVLSDGFWRRRFGSDPAIVGKSILVNGQPYIVVGVAPPHFSGIYPIVRTDAWVPLMMAAQLGRDPQALTSAGSGWLQLIGRLKDEVSVAQVRADLGRVSRAHSDEEPGDFRNITSVKMSRLTGFPADASPAIFGFIALLLVISGLVLVIASVNVASMLLARAMARRREMAVRVALGASRSRLVRQLLTESLVLFVAGGAGGGVIALWSTRLFSRIQLPTEVPIGADLSPDYRVMAFALGTALITGVIFGLAPALQATRQDPGAAMQSESAGAGARRSWVRNGLVVGQMAVALLLLMSAGLFVRALDRGQRVTTGIETTHVATTALDVGTSGYADDRARIFYADLKQKLLLQPGVTAVSYARWTPLSGSSAGTQVNIPGYVADGESRSRDGSVNVNFAIVSSDYFEVLQLPLLQGRGFLESDGANSGRVAIVNEEFVRAYWPGTNAVGRVFLYDSLPTTVVGVAKNAKYSSLNEPLRPFVYMPHAQHWDARTNLLVRTSGDAATLAPLVRAVVHSVDPLLPPPDVITMTDATSVSLLPQRIAAAVTAVMGLLGLVLAVVGLYGVVAYTVSQRTREIGLRMALGADRANVLRLILGDGMRLVLIGVSIGMVLAAVITRVMTRFLFGVSPLDPLVFALIPLGLGLVALFASYLPARRAAAVEPLEALRAL